RRIIDPLQPPRPCVGEQGVSRVSEQRTPQPARAMRSPDLHRGQPVGTGGAQRAQQEGFGLVVGVVRQCQHFPFPECLEKRRVARRAGRPFQAQSAGARDLDPADGQRYRQDGADGLAVVGPGLRGRIQPVAHVDGTQGQRPAPGRGGEQVQQHGRVEAAAQAQQDAAGRGSVRCGRRGKGRECGIGHAAIVACPGPGCGPGQPATYSVSMRMPPTQPAARLYTKAWITPPMKPKMPYMIGRMITPMTPPMAMNPPPSAPLAAARLPTMLPNSSNSTPAIRPMAAAMIPMTLPAENTSMRLMTMQTP